MAKSLRIIVIVIGAIVTICAAITDEQRKQALEHAHVCIQKTGVSKGDVLKVMAGDFSVQDKKIECFAKCFFEESGFIDVEGDFLDDVAIEKLSTNTDEAKVEALVNTCKLRIGATPCETAYKMYQCYVRHRAI